MKEIHSQNVKDLYYANQNKIEANRSKFEKKDGEDISQYIEEEAAIE